MSGKEVLKQRTCSPISSGALSHVYIQHPPLRCGIPETHGLYYDDGNKLVLSPTSDQILSWQVGSPVQTGPPDSDYIGEGLVLSVRYSLDKKLIAVQRSDNELQLKNRDSGETFIHRCKLEAEKILGFFWTDCPSCDIVLVKTSGLDMLSVELGFNRLLLVESKRLNVSWYTYTHSSRMILLASGMQCKQFLGFQFSSAGIVRLPKFEMKLSKAESNHKPVLSAEDIHIVIIYGRIYCLQVDKVDMQLRVYRFYRDAVVNQGSLPFYSTRIAVSVVDNVLLVHQLDAKVVILYDVFLDSLAPVSAPLPLLIKDASKGVSFLETNRQTTVTKEILSTYDGMIYEDSWNFLVPDLVCDVEHGLVWRILLDLEAIAASSSEVPFLLEFLQRRRSEPMKAKQLCLMMMQNVILERRPMPTIARALSVVVTAYSQDARIQNASQKDARRISSVDSGPACFDQHKEMTEKPLKDAARVSESVGISSPSRNFGLFGDLASDSEERVISDKGKSIAEDLVPKSSSGSLLSHENTEKKLIGGISVPEVETSAMVSTYSDTEDSTTAVISPADMYKHVFSLVEEEMAGEQAFLVAVIVEFLRSAALEKVSVHPSLYVLMIRLLVQDNRYSELGQFVLNKIIEPSKEVALELLHRGCANIQTRNLGLDMLRKLSLHNDYLQILLQYGYYIDAINYVRKNKVTVSQPSVFLEAAFSGTNIEHLAAALRFFADYIPNFKSTSDFRRYSQLLNEVP